MFQAHKRLTTGIFAAAFAWAAFFSGSVAEAATEGVVYSFRGYPSDGGGPVAGLKDIKGALYGTTESGGSNCPVFDGCGTVFSINPATGAETVVYSFQGYPGDGALPEAGLIDVKGTLYGTTEFGGPHCIEFPAGCGTVFSINPATGIETMVYSFKGLPNGAGPQAGLVDVNSTLYGTTFGDGTKNVGTVFSINPARGADKVVYSFCSQANCTDGAYPDAGLKYVNGTLYGTTAGGGTKNDGTVFSINPATGAETVVYSFQGGTDGIGPQAGVIDVNGTLYGTTSLGGTNKGGTVFSIDPTTGAETVLYSFCGQANCTDGSAPVARLKDIKGTLYGTTEYGGTQNNGTVFSINPTTGAETVVHSFQGGADGATPLAGLIDFNGTLYGTTEQGGASNEGTVFYITP